MTEDPGYIDSHCHLDRYPCPKEIVHRAQKVGIKNLLSISVHKDNAFEVLKIAEEFSCVYASVGVHPCDTNQESLLGLESWLITMSSHKKVLGLGETGIDMQETSPQLDLQLQGFEAHVNAALHTALPLIVHIRKGFDVLFDFWKNWNKDTPLGVLHCFSGTWEQAKIALDMGWYLSFSGIVTFKKNGELPEVVKKVPEAQFLLETDAPWLAPEPYRGRPNEPAYLVRTAEKIAQIRSCSVSQVRQSSTENFYRLFKKF
ncbi:putative deoxyribonuclease BUsg_343 [Holospora elegans E1]|uniref:Putative deoxyribonuclease BUsg_343 n=1 Tax=Holospora elegans E1 TaxID=1427503 RepID=A0A023DYS4_9PROT|nr:TatD family hydrolase [Holospora elegans]GAJ46656.1 putative deoxyribonuclease BUsg_343 [Holospora elegans E1]